MKNTLPLEIKNYGSQYRTIYKKILNKIKKHDDIVIFRHIMPDFDALGSQFGLYTWLKDNFPNKSIHVVGDNHVTFTPRIYPETDKIDESYFKDLIWKNYSLQKVYKPLNQVKLDLQAMYANLKLMKGHYQNLTPNIDFGGLKFNSTEAEFYSKVPLKLEKGTGTIYLTKVFGNGVAVEFVPFFPNLVQESVTFTASFTGAASNDIKMGDSINDVKRKMKPYYLKKNSGEWLTYLMPNGQLFDFRFNSSFLDQVTIREAPGWK